MAVKRSYNKAQDLHDRLTAARDRLPGGKPRRFARHECRSPQAGRAARAFAEAGIMVHAYLMYAAATSLPTRTTRVKSC